jgi:hypothetical protein
MLTIRSGSKMQSKRFSLSLSADCATNRSKVDFESLASKVLVEWRWHDCRDRVHEESGNGQRLSYIVNKLRSIRSIVT